MQCTVCSAENAADATRCATCGVAMVSMDDPNVLRPGTLLHGGAYAVGWCLGHGGFGITYVATDQNLRRTVAIKEYFPNGCARQGTTVKPSGGWTTAAYQDGRARFVLEGEALARFDHPGIVRVHAAFQENDTAYIVMEYLQGKNLEQILREQGGRQPVAEAQVCAAKIGAALDVVHGAGLLHRDIKPGNVMVVGSGSFLADPRVVLVDFGTAREFVTGVSQTHSVLLTRGYAPLEQYTRQAARGPYTDVYAVAALLYQALTGAPPPDAPERAYGSVLHDVRELNPEVGEAMGKAIMRGLEMEAGKRPQTVREFLGELDGSPASPAHVPTQVPTVRVTSPAPPASSPASSPSASSGQRHAGNPASPLPRTVMAGAPGGGPTPAGGVGGMAGGPFPAARPRTVPAWGWAIAAVVMVLVVLGLWWATSSATAYNKRGNEKIDKGDTEGAIADYNRAIEINPTDAEAYNNRGIAKAQKGDHAGAIADYNRAIEINPTDAEGYFIRGNAKSNKGDRDGAIADFTRAIELNPKLAYAYSNRGKAKAANGDHDGAIADYNRAIELNPKRSEWYSNRGKAKSNKGDTEGAIADCNRAIEIEPMDSEAYDNRGIAKAANGDHDGAIADYNRAIAGYNRAIELQPKCAEWYFIRGNAKSNKGDTEGAIADYNRAIEINPTDADAYNNRGIAKAKKGDHDGARADYRQARELDPRLNVPQLTPAPSPHAHGSPWPPV